MRRPWRLITRQTPTSTCQGEQRKAFVDRREIHLCRADVEKQRMNSNIKRQQMDDSKNEYANQLQKTNELQVSVGESE